MKGHDQKIELHKKYKNHRNVLLTLIKQSKQNYFKKYFEDNWSNMKNTWKGIKNMITLNNLSSNVSIFLLVNDINIVNISNLCHTCQPL